MHCVDGIISAWKAAQQPPPYIGGWSTTILLQHQHILQLPDGHHNAIALQALLFAEAQQEVPTLGTISSNRLPAI